MLQNPWAYLWNYSTQPPIINHKFGYNTGFLTFKMCTKQKIINISYKSELCWANDAV